MAIYDFDIEYNGKTGRSHGVMLAEFPTFEKVKNRYTEHQISGKIGNTISTTGGKDNAQIECELLAISKNVHLMFRTLRKWFSKKGKLRFTENVDAYYEVLAIESIGTEREFLKCGRLIVRFIIFPYEFLNSGDEEYESITHNPYCDCMPIYIVEGNGECVITVNDKTFKANVPGKLIIDTRRMIAYKPDGTSGNTLVTGDYENLWIAEGDVSISCTSGYKLKIIPKWGYWV